MDGRIGGSLSGVLDLDRQALVQGIQRGLDSIQARGMLQIEKAVDLRFLPTYSSGQIGFADAPESHCAVDANLGFRQRRKSDQPNMFASCPSGLWNFTTAVDVFRQCCLKRSDRSDDPVQWCPTRMDQFGPSRVQIWTQFGPSKPGFQWIRTRKCLKYLVGPRGFEPRTSCTPSKRATRLRYGPTR